MTNLYKYKNILLDSLLDLYGQTDDEKIKQGIFEAREIVCQSQATKEWIKECENNAN